MCKGSAKVGSLYCSCCGESAHLACLHKLFKDANNDPLKNKLDWLAEFIKFSSLAYQCKSCLEKHGAVPKNLDSLTAENGNVLLSINESVRKLNNQINDIQSKISDITLSLKQSEIDNSILSGKDNDNCIHIESEKNSLPSSVINNAADTQKSYAEIVKGDLANMVKFAVSASINEQKLDEVISRSIVIFGLKESNQDKHTVQSLLQCGDHDDYIARWFRMDKI